MSSNYLYKKLILNYGLNPYKYHYSANSTHIAKGYNEFCGDQINLYISKKQDKVKNISFLGKSCAISTASASLMIKLIENKSIFEIKKIFFTFSNMFIDNGFIMSFKKEELILKNMLYVKKYPSRIKCATLPWNILYNIILKKNI